MYPGEVQAEHEPYGVVFAGRPAVSIRLDISCARYLKDTALCINKWSIKSLWRFEQVIKHSYFHCRKKTGINMYQLFVEVSPVSMVSWLQLQTGDRFLTLMSSCDSQLVIIARCPIDMGEAQ